jgi:hypothetical protein
MADGIKTKGTHKRSKALSPFANNKSLGPFSRGAAGRRQLDEGQGSGDLNLHFQTTLSLLREANSAQVIFLLVIRSGSPVFQSPSEARKTIIWGFLLFCAPFGKRGW